MYRSHYTGKSCYFVSSLDTIAAQSLGKQAWRVNEKIERGLWEVFRRIMILWNRGVPLCFKESGDKLIYLINSRFPIKAFGNDKVSAQKIV
jgi:hypothetical protein